MSHVDHRIILDPKNFQVTFVEQAYCTPSKFQRRMTGWQPIYGAEWTTIGEARQNIKGRPSKCSRWNGLRIVKRVHHNGDIREYPVS